MGPPRQLNRRDAGFLWSDTTHSNANVSLVHIYDQSTAPGGHVRFKSILAHIESRLERSPIFRQRLVSVPFGLDYPHWVEDDRFDLEYHVRHIALPKPGDWRQFCIQVSRIHARPLDLTRPLWEIYVIEGLDRFVDLPRGSFALLIKVHSAAIDAEHGSELSMLLHDTAPHPPARPPVAPWFPESPPSSISLFAWGLAHLVAWPYGLAAPFAWATEQLSRYALSLAGDSLLRPSGVAFTRFNSAVSPQRVFDTRRFELAQFKAIRALAKGATVNDAVLAVCGGALRRYLQFHDELPEASVTAIAPILSRTEKAPAGKPRMSWLRVRLGSEIADPVERLRSIRRQTAPSTAGLNALGARELMDVEHHRSTDTLALTGKLLGRAMLGTGRRSPIANAMITNVPGPAVPLYLIGARMTYFSAIMPIYDGMGLVLAVTSYDGKIIVSPTSCRELLPDPERFSQCIRDSFQEYLALADAAAPRGAITPGARSASRSGRPAPQAPRARRAASIPRAGRAARPRSRAPSD